MSLSSIRSALRAKASPSKARILRGFFKTGPGEYGEGDRFIGVVVPEIRAVARSAADLGESSVLRLLHSGIHEERFLALVLLADRFARGDDKVRRRVFEIYLRNAAFINNWDLVDTSAPHIVGAYLWGSNAALLGKLARSPKLWERRIAIVATHHFIRRGRLTDTLEIAERLLGDPEDLMHKATGWMLREVGKKDSAALLKFLEKKCPPHAPNDAPLLP